MSKARAFVGVNYDRDYVPFMSHQTPTPSTHGDKYLYSIGPFRSIKDAEFYVNHQLYGSPVVIMPERARQMRLAVEGK